MSITSIIVAGGEGALQHGVKGFKKNKALTTLVEKNLGGAEKLLKKQLEKGRYAQITRGDGKIEYVRRTGNKGKIKTITADEFNKALMNAESAITIDTNTLVRGKLAKKFDGVKGKDSNSAFKAFKDAVESKAASLGELFQKATAAKAGGIKDKSQKDFNNAFKLLENAYEHQSPLQSAKDRLRAMVQAEYDRAANHSKEGAKTRAKSALEAIDSGNLETIKKTTKTMKKEGLHKTKGKTFQEAREAYKAAAKGQPAPVASTASAPAKTPASAYTNDADEMLGGYRTSYPYSSTKAPAAASVDECFGYPMSNSSVKSTKTSAADAGDEILSYDLANSDKPSIEPTQKRNSLWNI